MLYEIALGLKDGDGYKVLCCTTISERRKLIEGAPLTHCLIYMADMGWDFKGKVNKMLIWQRPKHEELPF